MPELPEIEHLRRTLEPRIVGRVVDIVRLSRRDFVHTLKGRRSSAAALLSGQRIVALHRHGKQLAVEGDGGDVMCLHLGMSGRVQVIPSGERLNGPMRRHVHCEWRLGCVADDCVSLHAESGRGLMVNKRPRRQPLSCGKTAEEPEVVDAVSMIFRDPRRFGGIWCFDSRAALIETRWSALGPDALDTRRAMLVQRLVDIHSRTSRVVKSVLLDQSVVAGLGNIYVDESCHRAGVHPLRSASSLSADEVDALVRAFQSVLKSAVRQGGSTLRDYADAEGRAGWFAVKHRVYGRAGLPCRGCGLALQCTRVAQRMTVFCPGCQPERPSRARKSSRPGRRSTSTPAD